MGFSNPATALNPFYLFRDEGFWPAISGEQFPPSLNGFSYGQLLSRPAYVATTVGGNGSITWPNMPRVAPLSGKQTLTISGFFANNGIASMSPSQGFIWAYGQNPTYAGGVLGYTVNNGPTVAVLGINGQHGNNYFFQICPRIGGMLAFDSGIPLPNALQWDQFIITILPNGSVTMQIIPGVGAAGAVLTDSRTVWPVQESSNIGLNPYFSTQESGTPSCRITGLRFVYS